MLNLFLPNQHVKSIFDIKPKTLVEKGIQGVITDLDNTLVAWDNENATEEVINWFKQMAKHKIKVMILSNNNKQRVSTFSKPLNVPYVYRARKPLLRSFSQAQQQFNLEKKQIAVIGDQLLTDILGGNLGGFYTILVKPIVETDAKITKLNRFIERRILNYFDKKGKLNKED